MRSCHNIGDGEQSRKISDINLWLLYTCTHMHMYTYMFIYMHTHAYDEKQSFHAFLAFRAIDGRSDVTLMFQPCVVVGVFP